MPRLYRRLTTWLILACKIIVAKIEFRQRSYKDSNVGDFMIRLARPIMDNFIAYAYMIKL